MVFIAGDLIRTSNSIAEVVDIDENGDLEVYFIVPNQSKANGKILEYNDEWETIKAAEVTLHVKKPKNRLDYPKAYREVGLKVWDGVIFTRVEDDEEVDDDLCKFRFPANCIEIESSEESDDDMSDFIVPDDEGEPFRPASPSSAFVRETHQAVLDYNSWVPHDAAQTKVKTFIDEMDSKCAHAEDDRQFVLGTSIDYNHPPIHSTKKSSD
jgi:hypothetical protein